MRLSSLSSNLRLALSLGEYAKCDAHMRQAGGMPLDAPLLRFAQAHWDDLKLHIANRGSSQFDLWEGTHFSHQKFKRFLKDHDLADEWPLTEKSGAYRLDEATWDGMLAVRRDLLEPVYSTLKMGKLNIASDLDGRNRVMLGAVAAISSRNLPGKDEAGTFIFAGPKWQRFFIRPAAGSAIAHLDFSGQEFAIGACLSGDENMIAAYESGAQYEFLAKLVGAMPADATKKNFPRYGEVRSLYKITTLGKGYGQTPEGLAQARGIPLAAARKAHRDFERAFPKFTSWGVQQQDLFAANLYLRNRVGWTLFSGPRTDRKPKVLLNSQAQSMGAAMLRLAIQLTIEAGVRVLAPIHDAMPIEAPRSQIRKSAAIARECMEEASAVLLDGYRLRVDCDEFDITPGKRPAGADRGRFFEEAGFAMWRDKITPALRALGKAV